LVIAFGGVDRDQVHHNDAIFFSSKTQKWMKADQKGTFGDVSYLKLLKKVLIRSQLACSLYICCMTVRICREQFDLIALFAEERMAALIPESHFLSISSRIRFYPVQLCFRIIEFQFLCSISLAALFSMHCSRRYSDPQEWARCG
jgi:hypothetical protein